MNRMMSNQSIFANAGGVKPWRKNISIWYVSGWYKHRNFGGGYSFIRYGWACINDEIYLVENKYGVAGWIFTTYAGVRETYKYTDAHAGNRTPDQAIRAIVSANSR